MFNLESTVLIVIFLALIFNFVNGFHDTANAVATSIATRALTPESAIIISAILNFAGALSSTAVALTIGKGLVEPKFITQTILMAALIGAIFWNLITWYYGIPSSSSHALVGGLVGAMIVAQGVKAIILKGLIKIILALLISPVLGLAVGFIMMTIFFWIFRNANPNSSNNIFRKLQVFSSALTSFSHGSNDAQKTMGIITLALFSANYLKTFEVPFWVTLISSAALSLGTAIGGKKIIRTMGNKIFKLQPINGFASDLSSSFVILGATLIGAPVSTTHVVSSSIMGVGAAKRLRAVKWGVAQNIVMAWFLTIPLSAIMSAGIYFILNLFKLSLGS